MSLGFLIFGDVVFCLVDLLVNLVKFGLERSNGVLVSLIMIVDYGMGVYSCIGGLNIWLQVLRVM